MLSLSAPLSSLTTYIGPDGECLHFSIADIQIVRDRHLFTSALTPAQLTIFPVVSDIAIQTRLSNLTGIPLQDVARHLAPINQQQPFFHLVHPNSINLQAAALHLPAHHYGRLRSSLHQFSPHSRLSFLVPISTASPAVPTLGKTEHPNPLSLLFLLENKILCHALNRLEIGISAAPLHAAPPNFISPQYQGA